MDTSNTGFQIEGGGVCPFTEWEETSSLAAAVQLVMQLSAEARGSASALYSSSLGSTQTAFTVFLNEGADPVCSILPTDFSVSFWTVVPRGVSWERLNNWLQRTQFFVAAPGEDAELTATRYSFLKLCTEISLLW